MSGYKTENKAGPKITRKAIFRAIIFLAPVLVYLPTFGGGIALPPGQGNFSDLLITHYPNLLYLRDSILVEGQVPLWSNLIYSGSPFAANPLAGVFYLPGWLAMFFPLPAGLSLVLAGHVVFGPWGMYRFLRLEKVEEAGSILGALGLGLMPKLAAHFGAGHISLIYAVSWTPWLLICSKEDQQGWRTGLVAGFLFLADPRWSIYAGLLWLTYDIAYRQITFWDRLKIYSRSTLIAVLISAPLLIPMMEFVRRATRSSLTAGDIFQGSLPASQLIGLLIPGNGGNIEWYCYLGGVSAALFVFLLFSKELRAQNRFWIAWTGLGILLSLGNLGIEIEWLSKIPLINLIRVPARIMFVVGVSISVISGKVISYLGNSSNRKNSGKNVKFGIFALGLMMVLGLAILSGAENLMMLWGFMWFSICGLTLLFSDKGLIKRNLGWIIAGILMIDVVTAGWASYDVHPKNERDTDQIQTYLAQEEGYFRTYSPSYSVDQHFAAENGLEIADGIDPMQIGSYAEFMSKATGVTSAGYSVTIPPYKTGDPARDNQGASPDMERLGLLNVEYVVSAFEIEDPALDLIKNEEKGYLYRNLKALPRAWVETHGEDQAFPDVSRIGMATISSRSPNRIKLEADGPGKLVLSEIFYPGWQVYVDGERTAVELSREILRSVSLSEGAHEIEFRFQPLSVYGGLFLAGIGLSILVFTKFGKKT